MLELPGTSAAELSLMLDVVDRHRCGETGQHVPDSLLRDLAKLVPFDDATFQVMDPYRHVISIQSVESPAAEDDREAVDLWWPAFWEHCSYPQRSGDFATVWRGSDAMPGTSAGPHWAEYLEASPESAAHHVVVSLPPSGAVDRRLILWRESDPDFSERDIHLLALLRPHLVEVYNHHQDAAVRNPGADSAPMGDTATCVGGIHERPDRPKAEPVRGHGAQAPGEHVLTARSHQPHLRGQSRPPASCRRADQTVLRGSGFAAPSSRWHRPGSPWTDRRSHRMAG